MQRDILREHDRLFEEKWGFSRGYSLFIREEMIGLIDIAKSKLRVLEVGCGAGANLYVLKHVNPTAELFGIEISEGAARVASTFADLYQIDVENFDMPEWEGTMDYIIFGDVLEHLVDPWKTLRNMAKALKIGGVAIISVPNIQHISVLQDLLQGHWKYENSGILDRTHLRFFTKETAAALVEQAGLKIELHGYRGIPCYQELAGELSALKKVKVDPENLYAYQWIIRARREE